MLKGSKFAKFSEGCAHSRPSLQSNDLLLLLPEKQRTVFKSLFRTMNFIVNELIFFWWNFSFFRKVALGWLWVVVISSSWKIVFLLFQGSTEKQKEEGTVFLKFHFSPERGSQGFYNMFSFFGIGKRFTVAKACCKKIARVILVRISLHTVKIDGKIEKIIWRRYLSKVFLFPFKQR